MIAAHAKTPPPEESLFLFFTICLHDLQSDSDV